MIAFLFQGLIGLTLYASARETVKRRWIRLRVNPFARYTEVLFLRRKPTLALIVLILTAATAFAIAEREDLQAGQAPTATGVSALILAAVTGLAVDTYVLIWIWRIFRNLRDRGLLNEFRLTRTTLQELLLPAFYRLTGFLAAYYALLGLSTASLHGQIHFLPLAVVSSIGAAYAYGAFLFCAFNHGLGLVRAAVLGIIIYALVQVLQIPLIEFSSINPDIGLPLQWTIQTIAYLGLGHLFFVSFLRTDTSAWAENLGGSSEVKSRLYY